MAISVQRWNGSSWVTITDKVSFRGYPQLGLQPLSVQKAPGNNTALARLNIHDDTWYNLGAGDEVRVVGTLLLPLFGGYVGRRTVKVAGPLQGANYELQDYNTVLDRCIISGYQIDDGDTDSTEITTLVNTYLGPIYGITVGQIDTVQATLEEIYLQCSFRQAMEHICGQASGAHFFIDALKQFHYVQYPQDLSAPSWTGMDLSDDNYDLTVGAAVEYEDLERVDDNTRRCDWVYIVGDGIEGWYPSAPGYQGSYQKIVFDETVTTQDALNALGLAVTGAWADPIVSYHLVTRRENPMTTPGVRFKNSVFTASAYESLYVHRAELWMENDLDAVACRLELGNHRTEDSSFGGGGMGGGGDRGPIFGDGSENTNIEPDDDNEAGGSRFAAREDHRHGITCAAPSNIGTSNTEGSATSFARSDHVHNHPNGLGPNLHHNQSHVLATNSGLGTDHSMSGATAGQVLRATSATAARWASIQAGDLPAMGGTPSLTLSTSNAPGSASTYVRTDATILAFDATAPDTITPDQVAAAGSAGVAARRDHAHAIACAAPVALGTANSEGSSSSFARADHVHNAFDSVDPDTITPDQAGAAGSTLIAARRDHSHGIACAAPSTNLSVSTSNGEGSSSSFARADHAHGITTSSNPGTAASILATDSNGQLRLMRLGIGGASTSSNNSIKVADDGWIGLAYDGTRLVFDDSDDRAEVYDGDLFVGTSGKGLIHTSGNTANYVWMCDGTRAYPQAIPAAAIPALGGTPALTLSTSNAAGSASTYIRTDATILAFSAAAPTTILASDTAGGAGSAGTAARSDHLHAISCAAPSTNLSATTTNQEGGGDNFARSTHVHAITASSNPGASVSLLETAADGGIQLIRLGIGTDPDTNNSIKVADDTWIGLGAAAGRIVFDSTATPDGISVKGARLAVGEPTTIQGMAHFVQPDTNGAIPVLKLEQKDMDVNVLTIVASASAGSRAHSLVDENDVGGTVRHGWIRAYIQNDGDQTDLTNGYYYIPLYSLGA